MADAVALSEALLETMRLAAQKTIELREPSITPRAMLLALLEDRDLGPAIGQVVNRDRLLAAASEEPAIPRGDTLEFKTPDGRGSAWLSEDAYDIFAEGARRAETAYLPRHLALGLAAQAVLAPGVLTAIRLEPGVFADAIYKL